MSDSAYEERARMLSALVECWIREGYLVWFGVDEKEHEWPVLYAMLPSGQVSWHLSRADMRFFSRVNLLDVMPWDGHDTPTKWARVEAWAEEWRHRGADNG